MRGDRTGLIFWAAIIYLALGLTAGVFNREYTKGGEFGGVGASQLGVVHTHLLTLGFIMMLIVLLLELTVGLRSDLFPWFFWVYSIGMAISIGALFVRGLSTINGADLGAALSGVAGLGHIILTGGLVLLMIIVGRRLPGRASKSKAVSR